MAFGYNLEAEYEDGFTITQSDGDDTNPYGTGNTFTAIRTHGATDAGHGRLVRFSLISVGDGDPHHINWQELWDVENPRPIYYRQMQRSMNFGNNEDSGPLCLAHFFGYQYLDENGENVTKIEEIVAP